MPGCSGVYVSTCRFYIRKKDPEVSRSGWVECKDQSVVDTFLMSFLQQPVGAREYQDLCNLPDLNEQTLLHNLKARSVLWGWNCVLLGVVCHTVAACGFWSCNWV